MTTVVENDPLTEIILGLAIEVHRQLGPGLLETVYEECLCLELRQGGLKVERQLALPIVYKSIRLDGGYRLDIVVERQVIIEIKAVERLLSVHEAQMLTYMKLSGMRVGLLLNFNTTVLKDGIRRLTLRE
jgi:GxxExxY protein